MLDFKSTQERWKQVGRGVQRKESKWEWVDSEMLKEEEEGWGNERFGRKESGAEKKAEGNGRKCKIIEWG